MNTENTRVIGLKPIPTPEEIKSQFGRIDESFISESRRIIQNILRGDDPRLMCIIGPCSIHDYNSAIEYATYISQLPKYKRIYPVMRVYFEKPRTTVGWKGFIYDPDLNETNDIVKGLRMARKLLMKITALGVPVATEFLDTITPQYLADLVSWGAIGARTSESQIHRQLASGLSMPIGFKNLTSGDIGPALDGIKSAEYPHTFLGVDCDGKAAIVQTRGNEYAHLILRGGANGTNYDIRTIANLTPSKNGIVVDCSHGNSLKDFRKQALVFAYVSRLKLTTGLPIAGIMLESNLEEGNQKIGQNMRYGVSITDSCLRWYDTKWLLDSFENGIVISPTTTTLSDIRQIITEYDQSIINLKNISDFKIFNTIYNEQFDRHLYDIADDPKHLFSISQRLALSQTVAEIKFKENPVQFLLKENSILDKLTHIDRELEIIESASEQQKLYLKILEISKIIQVNVITNLIQTVKIGYLFGRGTFSHEAVERFRCPNQHYNSIGELYAALNCGDVDYALVPFKNSRVGALFAIPPEFVERAVISLPIECAVFSNTPTESYDTFYIQEYLDKEVGDIDIHYQTKKIVSSTREAIINVLTSTKPALTVAGKFLSNPMLVKIQDISDANNSTHFKLVGLGQ